MSTVEAQNKLTWALNELGASFEGAIKEKAFGEYGIVFKMGKWTIAKSVDIATIDDCVLPAKHIPEPLRRLAASLKDQFAGHAAAQ